jgi:hypothetical protein
VGAQDPHWIEYVAAFGGLAGVALALVAALYAKRSADSTDQAVQLARDEVQMAREEHNEFLRELRARAKFRLSLRTWPGPDADGVIREDATIVHVRVEIGLKNDGAQVAGETVLNVVAPRPLAGFRWCLPNGGLVPDARPPADTPEELTDDEGRPWPGQYLDKTIARVSRRSHYAAFVLVSIDVPRDGVRSVPLRVTAQADELPDDIDEEVASLMIRVALRKRG